jgi:hypothetical protein
VVTVAPKASGNAATAAMATPVQFIFDSPKLIVLENLLTCSLARRGAQSVRASEFARILLRTLRKGRHAIT